MLHAIIGTARGHSQREGGRGVSGPCTASKAASLAQLHAGNPVESSMAKLMTPRQALEGQTIGTILTTTILVPKSGSLSKGPEYGQHEGCCQGPACSASCNAWLHVICCGMQDSAGVLPLSIAAAARAEAERLGTGGDHTPLTSNSV